MKTVEIDQATAPLAEYAQDLENDPVILTRGGHPVAALTSLENVDWETIRLSTNPKFIALIERVRAEQSAQGGFTSEEVRQMFGIAGEETRNP
jgi:antitoxin (DNA-binding transcriptional repressor) of toxin-antitoxin stability system